MSGYKNFALAGAGPAGKVIVEELLKKKDTGAISSVSVLTRHVGVPAPIIQSQRNLTKIIRTFDQPDRHKDLSKKGAKIIPVDYASPSSLELALSGIDVVISASGLNGIVLQDALATSAKATDVKLFVLSDFGSDTLGQTDNNALFMQKGPIRKRLTELQLPCAVFYTGLFTEKVLFPVYARTLGLNFGSREFSIPGSGSAPISWITTEETAQFVVYALTALPREKVEWRIFRIEGDRISFNDIVAAWGKYTGQPVTVSHRPRSDFEETVGKNPTDYSSLFILQLDSGQLIVGDPSELANSEYPEWKTKKVIDVLVEIYG